MACTIDFRCLDEGFGGKTLKRKRSEEEADKQQQLQILNPTSISISISSSLDLNTSSTMDLDDDSVNPPPPAAKRHAVVSSFGKPTYDGVIAGKASGRKWKDVRTRRASSVHVSKRGTTAEQRAKEKEIKRAYREKKDELKEEIRKNKQDKRKHREDREKKKQENILRSGTKLQKITNPNTLKKIAKSKDRKLLKVVPDHVVVNTNNNNNTTKDKTKKKKKN